MVESWADSCYASEPGLGSYRDLHSTLKHIQSYSTFTDPNSLLLYRVAIRIHIKDRDTLISVKMSSNRYTFSVSDEDYSPPTSQTRTDFITMGDIPYSSSKKSKGSMRFGPADIDSQLAAEDGLYSAVRSGPIGYSIDYVEARSSNFDDEDYPASSYLYGKRTYSSSHQRPEHDPSGTTREELLERIRVLEASLADMGVKAILVSPDKKRKHARSSAEVRDLQLEWEGEEVD